MLQHVHKSPSQNHAHSDSSSHQAHTERSRVGQGDKPRATETDESAEKSASQQVMARAIQKFMEEFDTNQDGKLGIDEVQNMYKQLMDGGSDEAGSGSASPPASCGAAKGGAGGCGGGQSAGATQPAGEAQPTDPMQPAGETQPTDPMQPAGEAQPTRAMQPSGAMQPTGQVDPAVQKFMEEFDTNGDGKLDIDEIQKLFKQFVEGDADKAGGSPAGQPGGSGTANRGVGAGGASQPAGTAQPTGQVDPAVQKFMDEFDTNGDGNLDIDEIQKLFKQFVEGGADKAGGSPSGQPGGGGAANGGAGAGGGGGGQPAGAMPPAGGENAKGATPPAGGANPTGATPPADEAKATGGASAAAAPGKNQTRDGYTVNDVKKDMLRMQANDPTQGPAPKEPKLTQIAQGVIDGVNKNFSGKNGIGDFSKVSGKEAAQTLVAAAWQESRFDSNGLDEGGVLQCAAVRMDEYNKAHGTNLTQADLKDDIPLAMEVSSWAMANPNPFVIDRPVGGVEIPEKLTDQAAYYWNYNPNAVHGHTNELDDYMKKLEINRGGIE